MFTIYNVLVQANNRGLFFKDKQGQTFYLEALTDDIQLKEGDVINACGLLKVGTYSNSFLIIQLITC